MQVFALGPQKPLPPAPLTAGASRRLEGASVSHKRLLPPALGLLIRAAGILPDDASPACFSLKPQAGPARTRGAVAIIVHLSVSVLQTCAASSQHVHMLAST